MLISNEKTVGEIAAEIPAAARVFEQFGIDYCCGGKHPVEAVCRERRIAPDQPFRALDDACTQGEIADADWSGAPLRGLIGHILTPISKTEMPRIAGLFVKVVRAHGERERVLEDDDAGRALIQMRHLTRDYTIPDEACAAYRVRRSCGRIKGREQTPAQINRG